jgi:hypothetical protein
MANVYLVTVIELQYPLDADVSAHSTYKLALAEAIKVMRTALEEGTAFISDKDKPYIIEYLDKDDFDRAAKVFHCLNDIVSISIKCLTIDS